MQIIMSRAEIEQAIIGQILDMTFVPIDAQVSVELVTENGELEAIIDVEVGQQLVAQPSPAPLNIRNTIEAARASEKSTGNASSGASSSTGSSNGSNGNAQSADEAQPVKRGRGRPPGSKNKATLEREAQEQAQQQEPTDNQDVPAEIVDTGPVEFTDADQDAGLDHPRVEPEAPATEPKPEQPVQVQAETTSSTEADPEPEAPRQVTSIFSRLANKAPAANAEPAAQASQEPQEAVQATGGSTDTGNTAEAAPAAPEAANEDAVGDASKPAGRSLFANLKAVGSNRS